MRQLLLNVRPQLECRLDNFIVGDNAALLAALIEHGKSTQGGVLYVWGSPSSGRSHLLQAAVTSAQRPARYLAKPDALALTPQPGELLAIDDVQSADSASQAALFSLLIAARSAQCALLFAGDRPPAQLRQRDDVTSRLAQGLIFEIQPLNDTQKLDALRAHAQARGMDIGEDIFNYLLRHGRRDMPWLMAVLDALDEISLTESRRVTLPLVRELMQEG